jgi:hypothetical protein
VGGTGSGSRPAPVFRVREVEIWGSSITGVSYG